MAHQGQRRSLSTSVTRGLGRCRTYIQGIMPTKSIPKSRMQSNLTRDVSMIPAPAPPQVQSFAQLGDGSVYCSTCSEYELARRLLETDEYFSSNWSMKWLDDKHYEGVLLSDLVKADPPSPAAESQCSLCQFIQEAPKGHELRAFPLFLAYYFFNNSFRSDRNRDVIGFHRSVVALVPKDRNRLLDTTQQMLQQNPSRVLYRLSDGLSLKTGIWGNRIDCLVDFSLIQRWIDTCKLAHGPWCHNSNSNLEREARPLQGFRLINTDTGQIHDSSFTDKYVALSYVWGGENQGSSADWPQVIHDAMAVSKRLGYHYLWVDQYCIDQKNDEEKHVQMSNMDLIYAMADLTIVAAAGSNALYGLPGISRARSGSAQLGLSVANLKLTTVPPSAHSAIKGSTWWTRGWTLQEGILSSRLLVFTDDQVYFECGRMATSESFEFPIVADESTAESISKILDTGILLGSLSDSFGSLLERTDTEGTELSTYLRRYFALAFQYTRRYLTYDADSLNAFSGIIKAISESSSNSEVGAVHSYFGIPIIGQSYDMFVNSLRLSLVSWYHYVNWGPALDASFKATPPKRLLNFPSWSWTGWSGPVDFGCTTDNRQDFQPPTRGHGLFTVRNGILLKYPQLASLHASISLRSKDGASLSDALLAQTSDDFSSTLASSIWLDKPYTISFTDFNTDGPGRSSYPSFGTSFAISWPTRFTVSAAFGPDEDCFFSFDLSLEYGAQDTVIAQLKSDQIKCIVMFSFKETIFCLLVKLMGNVSDGGASMCERIGLCHIFDFDYPGGFPVDVTACMMPYIKRSNDVFCMG